MTSSEGAGSAPSAQRDGYDKTCIFCKIANNEADTEILYSDRELACFRDVKPGARHHYLIVPKKHIGNCMTLRKEHVPLVENMVEMGKSVLQKHVTDIEDVRLGFHVPPFTSVPHLHLHALAPASQMDASSLHMYGPQSCWFITADNLLKKLNSQSTFRTKPRRFFEAVWR
ncbi:histidine triad nucleotide-binding protein 3-like [Megalops cyprinoides]|uniref:histidine triad nucleotide-binding protein 3-like n=1 Tax=Megalops cyprinoides TaxID=118141 RepID=UPI0018650BC4|nr:histidine triad nucleotide-binding protein 3-like [Megalops cyprinoides]